MAAAAAAAVAHRTAAATFLSRLEPFLGTEPETSRPGRLATWHQAIRLAFQINPVDDDVTRTLMAVSALSGPALSTATSAINGPEDARPATVAALHALLSAAFISPAVDRQGLKHLIFMKQNREDLATYCNSFAAAAAATMATAADPADLSPRALILIFARSLKDSRLPPVIFSRFPATLPEAITLVMDFARGLEPQPPHPTFAAVATPAPPPTRPPPHARAAAAAVDPARRAALRRADGVPDEEAEHRIRHRLCIYCGQAGHRRSFCPRRRRGEPPVLTHAPATGFPAEN